jgi:hypothetical protein
MDVYRDQASISTESGIWTIQNNKLLYLILRYCILAYDNTQNEFKVMSKRNCLILLIIAMAKMNAFRKSEKKRLEPCEDDPSVVRSVDEKIQEWSAELGGPEFSWKEAIKKWNAFSSIAAKAGVTRPAHIGHSSNATILLSELQFNPRKYTPCTKRACV